MKSGFPYLVDLSLTNQCPLIKSCGIGDKCYASPVSKTEIPTSWDYFDKLVDEMYKSNVLEVAIGGYSEPTTAILYRDWDIKSGIENASDWSKKTIVDVCRTLKQKHFKVGITTRNYNIHKHPKFNELVKYVDSIAFSASNIDDLKKIQVCVDAFGISTPLYDRITIQPILETLPFAEFKKLIKYINNKMYLKITLLGYKDFGFGKSKKPYIYDAMWIDFMQKLNIYGGFGVDSQIVADWGSELLKLGVEEYRLVGREGSSTCFVDVQKKQMKPSSFTNVVFDMPDVKKFKELWEMC